MQPMTETAMQCPIDGTQLQMTDRAGVEIDYCPKCRGVWLDRGELDKIIERSGTPIPETPGYGQVDQKPYKKKKRGGFLEDLFDF
tara:strand:+ start:1677 stop:1931 length:255 start_codon:yes stop_codon:yes gene_type:complete